MKIRQYLARWDILTLPVLWVATISSMPLFVFLNWGLDPEKIECVLIITVVFGIFFVFYEITIVKFIIKYCINRKKPDKKSLSQALCSANRAIDIRNFWSIALLYTFFSLPIIYRDAEFVLSTILWISSAYLTAYSVKNCIHKRYLNKVDYNDR
ncbi:hypothetical protein [Thermococcus sp.]